MTVVPDLIHAPSPYKENILRAIQFLEAHIADDILLEDIADFACLSSFHFHRIFKTFTQTTTKQYLTRLRLEKAANALIHTHKDIAQIAIEIGYNNHETFTRSFKGYFDITPQQYRRDSQQVILQKKNLFASQHINLENLNLDKPTIQFLEKINVAFIRHTGSYAEVGKVWNKLFLWNLTHFQFGMHTSSLGIVHDNPQITDSDNIRYDACIVIKTELKPRGEIQFKQIAGGKYAIFRYKGRYDNFYVVYDYIYSVCLLEFGYCLRNEPALEWYIKSPPFYKPENYLTEFYVPIE
jgi:AraC family transcriptional regulator